MGSWWRSEEMTYVSILFSEEAAQACITELGELGCLQFTDLNPDLTPFQRRYVSFIKRCDEIERRIRYVNGEVKKMGVPVQPAGEPLNFAQSSNGRDEAAGAQLLEFLENRLEQYEQQLLELNKYSSKITEEYSQKVEFHHLLVKARKFLGEASSIQRSEEVSQDSQEGFAMNPIGAEERGPYGDDMTFNNLAGVVGTGDRVRFERMLYRSTRGNCYIRFSALSEKALDANGAHIDKVCFIIFFKSTAIEAKIRRICDAFSANRYDMSDLNRPKELEYKQKQNQREMQEAKVVLDRNTESRLRICVDAAASIESWMCTVRREKGTYHTLNQFKNDVAKNLLRGRGWILTGSIPEARRALKRAHVQINLSPTAMMETVSEDWPEAPTHFHTNKYTWAFQEFVNTYGLPRYREINPALFTAATFPFLFGVMYGDIGHGTVLAMGGLYLILTESRANARGQDEMITGIYSARYMLLAMGLFAIYAGLVYNDYFSLGLDLFGSKYTYASHEDGAQATTEYAYGDPRGVYSFGADPAWKISGNELLFFNSMKMKMSVILGITQMTFGILLKGVNSYYFKANLDLYCEFLPMILFDMSLFGYMVVLIFVKWSINWQERMALGTCGYSAEGEFGACSLGSSDSCYSSTGNVCTVSTPLADVCPLDYGGTGDGCQPPNLITTLINIALKPGDVDEPMFAGQAQLQTFLLLVAFVCVPWLLLVKPFMLARRHHAKNVAIEREHHVGEAAGLLGSAGAVTGPAADEHEEPHEEHAFGEIVIHQAIETIEFVLGMVSNTASYLRLWALSLAHTELAT
ncbi:V-type ATPase, V0 complex, 116kDa subunit family, partial [Ochromonadaceae sp. CCMP2298]